MARSEGDDLVLPGAEVALLGEMLHALGQPLTVLGGCRLLARMPRAGELELLEDLADQVDRATELYEGLRLLLEGSRDDVAVSGMRLEWERRASGRRLPLRFEEGQGAAQERVLEGVFQAALRSCAPGEELQVRVREGWLDVDGGSALEAEVPWALRVAEAVVRGRDLTESRVAGVVYKLQPFHARVRLHPV